MFNWDDYEEYLRGELASCVLEEVEAELDKEFRCLVEPMRKKLAEIIRTQHERLFRSYRALRLAQDELPPVHASQQLKEDSNNGGNPQLMMEDSSALETATHNMAGFSANVEYFDLNLYYGT